MATYHPAPDFPPTTNSRKRPFEGGENAGPEKAYKKEKTSDEKSADANALPQVDAPNGGGDFSEPDEDILLRVLAESRHCGGLIGRSGATINAMREESGATVEVKSPVPYATKRIMRVKGPLSRVIKGVHLVLEQLAKTIVDSKNRKAERTKSAAVQLAGAQDHGSVNNPDTLVFEFTMLIPGPQIGAVIGKGGCNISETRTASGTSIAVAAEYLPNSSEKTVAITGTHKSIAIAAERILRQVATCAEKGEAEYPYEPQPEDDAAAAAASHAAMFAGGPSGPPPPGGPYGGRGGGGGGGSWNIGARQGGRGGGRGGGGGGWNANPYNTQNNGWEPPNQGGGGWGANQGHNQGGWGGSPQGGPPSNRWAGGSSAPQGGSSGPEVTVPFPVSKSLVGAVIGRGGQNITAIRARSGATVRIEDPVDGSDERMITITGSGLAVKAAVTMIQYHLQHQ